MMSSDKTWKPEFDEATLRGLIEEAVQAIGPNDPGLSPPKVRARLVGRITGEVDLDRLIGEIIAEQKG